MRITSLIAILAVAGGVLGAGATLVPVFARPSIAPDAAQPTGLTMQQVLVKLEAAGYREFRTIERERDRYEVKAIDPQGRRVEVAVDPVTGDVLKTEARRSQ